MRKDADPIDQPPSITGARGRAWEIDIGAACDAAGKSRQDFPNVAGWIIEAEWAHPIWHSYWLTLIHLRPVACLRPSRRYVAGATHELLLLALDPERPRQPQIMGQEMAPMLPANFATQLIEPSDADAMRRAEAAVRMVCDGALSPDSDFRRDWAMLLGDNMMRDRARA